jgi:hypothetical protein
MKNALKFAPEEPAYIVQEIAKLEPHYLNLLQGVCPSGGQVLLHRPDNTAIIKAILNACTAYRKAMETLRTLDYEINRYMKKEY